MKRTILLSFGLLLAVAVSAASRTVDEAAAIAARFAVAKAPAMRGMSAGAQKPELAFTQLKPASAEAAFYVFNPQGADGGFIIVSADDRTRDILAYTDGPAFDKASVNPSLQWWMDATASRVAHAVTPYNGGQRGEALPPVGITHPTTPVAPLLGDIEWGQYAPYNLLCPMDGEYRSVTGCVATAGAQIMRYWQWPLQGKGSHSYEWNGQTLTADFGSTRYDWDNMPANYDLYVTDEQNQAVATLLYQLGVSVNMYYSYEGSGSITQHMAEAMTTYFSYKATYSWNTGEDCLAIINADLDQARPVFLAGTEGENATEGHAFVCDGRDVKGYLHINWGWDGSSNGYFDFENLGGFGYDIELIHGIEPDIAEEVPAQGIAVSPAEVTLRQGEKTQLQVVVTPAYATRQAVTWATDNASVATVDGIGMVTAHTTGTARITATMGDHTAVATVNVNEFIYAPPHFELVTDEDDFSYGDEFLIVDTENSVAMSLISHKVSRLVENVQAVPVTIDGNAIDLDEYSEASIFTYYTDGGYAVFVNQQGNYLSSDGPNRLGWTGDGWHWEYTMGADGAVSMQAAELSSSSKTCYLGYSSSQGEYIYNRKTGISLPRLFRRCEGDAADTDYSITDLQVNTDGLHVTIGWKTEAPFCRMEIWDQYMETQYYQTQLKGPGDYTFQYDLPASGRYRYRIYPITASGNDDYHSTGGYVTVANPADYIPTGLGVTVEGYEATFSWTAIAPAPMYQFQILLDGEVAIDELIRESSIEYSFIRQFNATWRVRAVDAQGEPLSEFVDGGAFAITGSADDPQNLTATSTDGYTYTLAWDAGPRDTRTVLELDIEIDGNLYLYEVIDNATSPYVKELSMNGRYEWFIKTYDAEGNFIGRADGPSFVVVAPDYSVTNLRADVDNYQATITWDGCAPYYQVIITNSQGEVKFDDIITGHSYSINTVIRDTYTVTVTPVNAEHYTLDDCAATTTFVIGSDYTQQVTRTYLEINGSVIYFCWDGPADAYYNLQIFYSGQLIGNYLVPGLSGGINFAGLEGETFTWRVCICDGEGNPLSDYADGGTFTVGADPTPQTSDIRVYIPEGSTMSFAAGAWLWWWPEGQEGSCVPLVAEGNGWYHATVGVPEGSRIGALVVNRDVSTYGWDGAQQTIDTPIFASSTTGFALGEYDDATGKWDLYAVPEGAFTEAFLPHDLVTTVDGANAVMQWENGAWTHTLWILMKDGWDYQSSLTTDNFQAITLDEPGTYTWCVCAADDQHRPLSDYVVGEPFTYSGDPSADPEPTATTTDGYTYAFQWNDVEGATQYIVRLYFDIDGTAYYIQLDDVTPGFTYEMFQSGPFTWTLYALNANGTLSITDGNAFNVTYPEDFAIYDVAMSENPDGSILFTWQSLAKSFDVTFYDKDWNLIVNAQTDKHEFSYHFDGNADGTERLYYIFLTPMVSSGFTVDEFQVGYSFTITDTGIRQQQADEAPVKQLRGGQVIIVRDGRTYNMQGIELE